MDTHLSTILQDLQKSLTEQNAILQSLVNHLQSTIADSDAPSVEAMEGNEGGDDSSVGNTVADSVTLLIQPITEEDRIRREIAKEIFPRLQSNRFSQSFYNRVSPYRAENRRAWRKLEPVRSVEQGSIELPSLDPRDPKPCFDKSWRYCTSRIFIVSGAQVSYGCSEANMDPGFPLYSPSDEQPQGTYLRDQEFTTVEAIDYVPPWEIRLNQEDQKWYHIDDSDHRIPLEVGADEIVKDGGIEIPYSQTPPLSHIIDLGAMSTASISKEDWTAIKTVLGTIYAVPPDSRVEFTFMRNELRKLSAKIKLASHLENMDKLRACDGSLIQIFDYSMNASSTATYDNLRGWHPEPNNPIWRAAGPALTQDVGMPTTFVTMETKSRVSGSDELPHDVIQTYSNEPTKWWRVVSLTGLDRYPDILGGRQARPLDNLLFCGFHRMISMAFQIHLESCTTAPGNKPWFDSHDCGPFQITWHRIAIRDVTPTHWKVGPIHGRKNHLLQRQCFTLAQISSPSRTEDVSPDYWTILLMAPGGYQVPERSPLCLATAIITYISDGMKMAATAWDEVHDHFTPLVIDDPFVIADPAKHDSLLFDDDSFSRSRRYFWILSSVDTFIEQIENTIINWEKFSLARRAYIDAEIAIEAETDRAVAQKAREAWASVEAHIGRLQTQKKAFENMKEKVNMLREGLFNASSVVEARAATNLGHNVQLLTYVSIFYLPLALCVSIWGIDSAYSRKALIITSVITGAVTYLVVANLQNLTAFLKLLYRLIEGPIVKRMQEQSSSWETRADNFRSFRPERERIRPSKWLIFFFPVWKLADIMVRPVKWVIQLIRRRKTRVYQLRGPHDTI